MWCAEGDSAFRCVDQSSLSFFCEASPSLDSFGKNAQSAKLSPLLFRWQGSFWTHIIHIIGMPPLFVHCQNGEESPQNFCRLTVKQLENGRAGSKKRRFFLKLWTICNISRRKIFWTEWRTEQRVESSFLPSLPGENSGKGGRFWQKGWGRGWLERNFEKNEKSEKIT